MQRLTSWPGRRLRVFLLDDHHLTRAGIRSLLEAEDDIEVVGEAATAAQAVEEILRLRPDVAVLDGRLPDGTGMEVCREVRSADPEVAALILTSYNDDEALVSALVAGAAGYVIKDVRARHLVDVVRRVARGESLMDAAAVAEAWEGAAERRRLNPTRDDLSPQESQVFDLIAEGLTNRQIAQRLCLSEKTVKNYVTRILAKLGLSSRTKVALMALHSPQPGSPRSLSVG